ncbi:hypothetical protein PVAP13_9KG535926 [Panicum virgatum]|uniref:Uncharacterized protein n=1 Tax=Panicum virgatum TaxID=38727 RepID=A0A8T0NUH7_PANVG|nr:hypothetical protein PVAP13_9KG535926 [Panicum virgatum]KAG2553592.1 hypothetical protein PVAP13_9KG535926 [Panicum virgatum]KAG2553593.1 hypothetical protein PVAP13_9KG535926 [Panicum virgatum]
MDPARYGFSGTMVFLKHRIIIEWEDPKEADATALWEGVCLDQRWHISLVPPRGKATARA